MERLILEVLFADDCALLAYQENLQSTGNCGQILRSIQDVWPDNRPRQYKSSPSARTRQFLPVAVEAIDTVL